jgi:hypothetical protein
MGEKDEIEITPEMIEAGARALMRHADLRWDFTIQSFEAEHLVSEIVCRVLGRPSSD